MSIAEKLQTVAENQKRVYDAGYAAGQTAGGDTDAAYQEGYDAGKQAQYDAFWDEFQENGNRTNYAYAFAGYGWEPTTFKPKYDLKPTNANYMFAYDSLGYCDLTEILSNLGIVLDTSQCTAFQNFTEYTSPARFPVLDMRAASNLNNTFSYATVRVVDKIILKEDGSQTVKTLFNECQGLKDVEIEGVIGNDIVLSKSTKLTNASITSFINALSTTATDKTLQLSLTAVNTAFETSEGAADGSTSAEWQALVASKPNWTITLA